MEPCVDAVEDIGAGHRPDAAFDRADVGLGEAGHGAEAGLARAGVPADEAEDGGDVAVGERAAHGGAVPQLVRDEIGRAHV